MRRFAFWFQFFAAVSLQTKSEFLQDLISYQANPFMCNIMTCNEHDSINLIKMLSTSFQRFGVVHKSIFSGVSDDPQNFIIDLRCPEAFTVLRQANDSNLFRKPFQWLLLGDGVPYNTIYKTDNVSGGRETWFWTLLESLNMQIDSDVKVLEKTLDERFVVTGVYNFKNVLVREPLAEWTPEDGLVVINSKSVTFRRWKLSGVTFQSSIVFLKIYSSTTACMVFLLLNPARGTKKVTKNDSLNHMNDLIDKHIDTLTKVVYNMVNLFEDIFNASINYKTENEWGVLVNGSWTGMTGDLERKEIDFGAAPLFFQEIRLKILEYIAMVTPSRCCTLPLRVTFIFLSPSVSYSTNIFILPFNYIVWYCCIVMVLVSCLLLYVALNCEKIYSIDGETDKGKIIKTSFTEILVINIGAICLQGTFVQTKNPPARIITLFLYLSYMFLYVSYSAAVVALLQSSDTSIQTLRDLQQSNLKAGAEDVVYSRYYFQHTNNEIVRALYEQKLAPKGETPHFLPVEEGIRKLQEGFYAFSVETNSGYYVIQKLFNEYEKCALQELKDSFVSNPWVVIKKRSPYGEHFKIGIKMSMERGFNSRILRRYYTNKPVCTSKSSRFASVGLIECFYAFMLLACGWVSSFWILLLEIIFKKCLKIREKRRRLNESNLTHNFEFLN